ncbi:MAG: PAS domain-containing protein, partial [Gammaproteobacteria bacterium]
MKGLLESDDPAELRQIIDYLGIAAFVIDVDPGGVFRLAAINERHEQLTGMHHSRVAGHRIDKILPPEMAEQVMVNYRRCVQQRAAIDYQESLDLPVGITYWRTTLVPYMDVDGRVFRLLGTSIEITGTVHLELESRYQSTVLSAYLD